MKPSGGWFVRFLEAARTLHPVSQRGKSGRSCRHALLAFLLVALALAPPCFAQVGPVRVQITPANSFVTASGSQQFNARVFFLGNRTGGADVTNQVTWQSSDTNVASVTGTGMVTATNHGIVTITAIRGPFRGTTTLTVTPNASLTSVTITPASPSIPKGLKQQFTLTGNFSGTSQDITPIATWISSDVTIAGLRAPGLFKGLQPTNGSPVTITASFSGHSDSTQLTVTAPILQSLVVSPPNAAIPLGLVQQFSAIGHLSDDSTQDLTALSTWASTNGSAATINSTGLATSHATGSTTISAAYSSFSGSTLLTVAPPALASIAVTPVNPAPHPGTSVQLTAIGTFTNGSSQNMTASVSWRSSNTAVASVGASGLVSAFNAGSATITATAGGFMGVPITGATTVSVPALVSIAIGPAKPTIAQGSSLQLSATGTFSDASTQDLTSLVAWSSSNTAAVSVNGTGLITGNTVGFSTITATLGSVSGTASALVGFSALSVNGTYAFSLMGADVDGEFLAAGSFRASGDGSISNGVEDFNGTKGVQPNLAFSGSYAVGLDGRGSATLSTGDVLKFVMTASGNAVVIQFNNLAVASGTITQQDTGAFQNLQGNYAFQFTGLGNNGALADVGIFTADGGGNISNGKDDFNYTGSVGAGTSTGTYTGVDAHGRGTMTWHFNDGSNFHFSFYILDHNRINIVSLDLVPAFLGVAQLRSSQTFSNSSLDSFYVFSEKGVTTTDKFQHTSLFDAAGVFQAHDGGKIDGRQDSDEGASPSENATLSGTYSIAPNGRGTAIINDFPYVFYMVSPSLAYFMNTDSGAVLVRTVRSQPAVQFSTSSFQGNFNLLLSGEDLLQQSFLAMSGQMFADGGGTLSGTEDINDNGSLSANVAMNGTYSVEIDGRGSGSINGPNGTMTIHFYMVNTNEAVFVETDNKNNQIGSAQVQF